MVTTSVLFLEGELAAWVEMLQNIRQHGGADVAHSLNTLTHFGERLQMLYADPDNRDKFFRFQESLQEFFDLASAAGCCTTSSNWACSLAGETDPAPPFSVSVLLCLCLASACFSSPAFLLTILSMSPGFNAP